MACSTLAAAHPSPHTGKRWHSLKSGDFGAALAGSVLGKSPHFMLHHIAARPNSAAAFRTGRVMPELSTESAPIGSSDVDNNDLPTQWWLGLVVPKRHARRAVTRTLLKRQMRAQAEQQRDRIPAGQWIIRLRAPFDPKHFPSAASSQLREAARRELEGVFAKVVAA
jgi:ribonuclease P protein component